MIINLAAPTYISFSLIKLYSSGNKCIHFLSYVTDRNTIKDEAEFPAQVSI